MDQPAERFTSAQLRLAGFIAVLAVTAGAYRLVHLTGLHRTAALYIGIPAVLAIGLALLPRSRSATDMCFRGSLIALLVATVVLPEGLICLLFAAPFAILIPTAVGASIDRDRARALWEGKPRMLLWLPLLVLSLEGVVGSPFDPHATATASITVAADADRVAAALARPPDFDEELPAFLRVGFNRPIGSSGEGIAVGDRRVIAFDGGTHDDHPRSLAGMGGGGHEHHHAQMELSVVESEPGRVVFAVDRDGTMLARWVDLDRAVVTWRERPDGTTEVTWALEYERLLHPTFYWAPIQGYGMDRAAAYLLDAVVAGAAVGADTGAAG